MTELNPNFLSLLLYTRHLSGCNDKTQSWFFRSREGTPDEADCTEEENQESVLAVDGWSTLELCSQVS